MPLFILFFTDLCCVLKFHTTSASKFTLSFDSFDVWSPFFSFFRNPAKVDASCPWRFSTMTSKALDRNIERLKNELTLVSQKVKDAKTVTAYMREVRERMNEIQPGAFESRYYQPNCEWRTIFPAQMDGLQNLFADVSGYQPCSYCSMHCLPCDCVL